MLGHQTLLKSLSTLFNSNQPSHIVQFKSVITHCSVEISHHTLFNSNQPSHIVQLKSVITHCLLQVIVQYLFTYCIWRHFSSLLFVCVRMFWPCIMTLTLCTALKNSADDVTRGNPICALSACSVPGVLTNQKWPQQQKEQPVSKLWLGVKQHVTRQGIAKLPTEMIMELGDFLVLDESLLSEVGIS